MSQKEIILKRICYYVFAPQEYGLTVYEASPERSYLFQVLFMNTKCACELWKMYLVNPIRKKNEFCV